MTRAQILILTATLALIAAQCVWVPWAVNNKGDHVNFGYGLLWSGPHSAGEVSEPDLLGILPKAIRVFP